MSEVKQFINIFFRDIIMKSNALKITLLATTFSLPLQATIMSSATLKLADASIPAEQVKKGQLINSLNKDKSAPVKASVLSATPSKTKSIVEIDLGDRKIQATENQTYYDPVLDKWIPANKLTPMNKLLGEDMTHKHILGTQKKTGDFDTMKISVDGSNYMFADGVLTHNFLFVPVVFGFLGYMIFGKKKGGKIVIDYGSGHNGSIVREHGNK